MMGAQHVNERNRCRRSRGGFAFQELLVVLMVIGMLVAFLVPMLRAAKQRSYGLQCADHLRQIGQGLLHYMAINDGALPRMRADAAAPATWGTGAAAAEPFSDAGPAANDERGGSHRLAGVAQLAAHPTCNRAVPSSSLGVGSDVSAGQSQFHRLGRALDRAEIGRLSQNSHRSRVIA